MSHPTWDMKIGRRGFKNVLQNPRDERFLSFFARLLSRVPFYEAFREFITPLQFKRYYRKARPLMDSDLLGAGRIEFWDWVYKKIS